MDRFELNMNMQFPLVSVLLPVFNGEKYISECIQSILSQTFRNFELLILNDGSTDATAEKIGHFKDQRINLFNFDKNEGYVFRLNQGIDSAKGKYLIRMDADDICVETRFEQLVQFMEQNTEIGVCGSHVKVFGEGKEYIWKLPVRDESLKALLPFRIPFVHPSVIIRKSVLTDHAIRYKHAFLPAEDYELWCNLSRLTKFANIPVVLLLYRQHPQQISKEKKQIQQAFSDRIREIYFKPLFNTKDEFSLYQKIVNDQIELSLEFLKNAIRLFQSMKERNEQQQLFNQEAFQTELSFQVFRIATHLSSNRIRTWKTVAQSGFTRSAHIPKRLYFNYLLKNLSLYGRA